MSPNFEITWFPKSCRKTANDALVLLLKPLIMMNRKVFKLSCYKGVEHINISFRHFSLSHPQGSKSPSRLALKWHIKLCSGCSFNWQEFSRTQYLQLCLFACMTDMKISFIGHEHIVNKIRVVINLFNHCFTEPLSRIVSVAVPLEFCKGETLDHWSIRQTVVRLR